MSEIPLFKVFMSSKASKAASKVLNSGYVGQGAVVEDFERHLKKTFSNDYVLTLNSCTSAIHLALHLLKKKGEEGSGWGGLTSGDEVLCTPLTCTATNWPVLANGLGIKWVDVDEKSLNMDLDDLARKITPSTKVILVVHWGGYPCDLDRLKDIQNISKEMYGIKPAVIEDCAHSFGSTYRNNPLSAMGNICCYSFQAIKHCTSVDGGALVLPHQDLYRRGKLLRWYGIDRETNTKDFRCEDDIPEWGFKFHMNDLNAAIGIENLKKMDDVLPVYTSNAEYYNKELSEVEGVQLLEGDAGRKSAYWQYTILVDRRDDFTRMMQSKGIMVSRVHERNDKHPCVKQFKSYLPTLDKVVKKMVCIPVGWWVGDSEREYIVESMKEGW